MYLSLQALLSCTVSPTGLNVLCKYTFNSIFLHHNPRYRIDSPRPCGPGADRWGRTALLLPNVRKARIVDLAGGILRLGRLQVPRIGIVLQAGGREDPHRVVVLVFVVILADVLRGVVVRVGVCAAGADAVEIVVGGEGAVAGVGEGQGEGGGGGGVVVVGGGRELAFEDGAGDGGGGGMGGRGGLGAARADGGGRMGGVPFHLPRVLEIGAFFFSYLLLGWFFFLEM